jgi:hypothetical protein
MALWQYHFHLLPRLAVEALWSEHNISFEEEGFDDDPFWKFEPVNKNIFQPIEIILPKNQSWSNSIEQYGVLDSNCLEVSFNRDDTVASASFRINYTINYTDLLNKLIDFFITNHLVIVTEELNIISPNFEAVDNIIQNCPQRLKLQILSSPPQ